MGACIRGAANPIALLGNALGQAYMACCTCRRAVLVGEVVAAVTGVVCRTGSSRQKDDRDHRPVYPVQRSRSAIGSGFTGISCETPRARAAYGLPLAYTPGSAESMIWRKSANFCNGSCLAVPQPIPEDASAAGCLCWAIPPPLLHTLW